MATTMVHIIGSVIQPDATRKDGPSNVLTFHSNQEISLSELIRQYERRHGACFSFTLKVVK